MPIYAAYGAAKSYVLSLGVALNHELRGTGVSCTVACPGVTATEFFQVAGQRQTLYQRMTIMPSAKVAEIALKALLAKRPVIVAGGLNAKVVVYPIAEGSSPASRITNWAVLVKVGEGNAPPPRKEDWSRPGRREELMPHVARFSVPYIDVKSLISATPEFYEYPTCDRDPLPYWSSGRVTLLGDAAHPMYPVGSNGASQAILDARCLADLLARSEHPRQALVEYEKKRLPMTAEIVRSNRRGGPEGVIDAVEQLAPDGFDNVENVLSYSQREAIVRGYATKAGFAAVPGLAAVRA